MLLKSGEAHLKAESMAMEIAELQELDRGPFPYEDCFWLQSEFAENLDDIVPDLDMWFMEIAGPSSWGKKTLSWSEEKILKVRNDLRYSFFETYPMYAWLKMHITKENTPDLYERFQSSEQLRKMLCELMDFMMLEKYPNNEIR